MKAVIALLALALPVAAFAQDGAAVEEATHDLAWHNNQQLAIAELKQEDGEPATFPLGRLVKAWQLAIPEMGVGDTIELYAPADLAYGPVGKGPIPGNATLVFKVELIGIE